MSEPVNLFAQQESNRRRSRWLVAGFILFFAWLGFGGDLILFFGTQPADAQAYRHTFPFLGIVMTALGAGLAAYAWRTGADKILWATGARQLEQATTDQERQLINVVEEMAIASGLPRPRIFVIPDPDPNAFATGRDPATSTIAVTDGLLAVCDRDELQGVIGHEMGHIKNLDVRLMTLLAALGGAVALMSEGMGRMIRFGGNPARSRGRRGKDGNPLVVILLVLWVISWILAPIITRLLALGVSRKREYLADAMSAQFTRNPLALAGALEKIERAHAPTSRITRGAAHLCIADPLGRPVTARQGWLADRLATHPPMAIRVSRLKAMAYQEMKKAGGLPELGSAPARASSRG